MDRIERVQLSGSLLDFLNSMGCTRSEVIDIAENLRKQALVYDQQLIEALDPVPLATLSSYVHMSN